MNFTLHQLHIFLEVSRHQNITHAAHSMFMTQPALSIQLKNFQSQFEIPLVEKVGKKIQLTDFGTSIATIAENILKGAEELKYKTKEYKGLFVGKLRISSACTGKYVIPYFLGDFINQHKGIDLTLDVSAKNKVVESLKNNEIDFALVSVVPDQIEINEEILFENKLYLVHNNSKMDKTKPLLYREKGSATREAMEQYFKKSNKKKAIELASNEAVKQALIAGLGLSIIPIVGIRNQLENEELYILPSKGLPIITHWRLIWLKNKKLSPIAEAYIEYIRKNKQKIIKENFNWINSY